MHLGRLGVWTFLDLMNAGEAAAFTQRVEALGYSTLWVPEAIGRDPFTLLGYLAARTERLQLATGIANIYARDPMTMRAIQQTMAELSGGRFVLGLGVSHAHLVSGGRGHEYRKPIPAMREYLEAMRGALYRAVEPAEEAPIMLAALRPAMLRLARAQARGAHPYFVTPEHTARARETLGPDAWLAPEQKVLLDTDADIADGGSDRLVDAIVAWGDEQAIADRIRAHHDAGADHVCIQPLRPDGVPGPDLRVLEALAPAR